MPQSPDQPRMWTQARRAEARDWIRSGARVSIRKYRKRYGVDQYTAYDDLRALGVALTPGDEQWAVRPAPGRPRPSRANRRRTAKQARHDAARRWIASGATKVNVRTYARQFGVDRYTAYADLRAIGFPLDPDAERWAARSPKAPKRQRPQYEPENEWIIVGDQRMFVVGYTSGGAPYGYVEDIDYDEPRFDGEPF